MESEADDLFLVRRLFFWQVEDRMSLMLDRMSLMLDRMSLMLDRMSLMLDRMSLMLVSGQIDFVCWVTFSKPAR